MAFLFEPRHLIRVDARLAALVDPGRLGFSDALELPLAPQIGLELGEAE
jgi:hypothetical protein